jgi:hypothetical protein
MFAQEAGAIEQNHRANAPVSKLAGVSRRGGMRARGAERLDHPLRCVWTGYPSNGCSCHSRVPKDVVMAAWQEELARGTTHADRFFHFIWHGGVWLAYGLKNGRVRGVCCPSHSAERAAHSHAADSPAGERSCELAPAA